MSFDDAALRSAMSAYVSAADALDAAAEVGSEARGAYFLVREHDRCRDREGIGEKR